MSRPKRRQRSVSTMPVDRTSLDRSCPGRPAHHRQSARCRALRQGLLRGQRTQRSSIYAQRQFPPGRRRQAHLADGYPVRDSQGAPLTLQAARPARDFAATAPSPRTAWSPANWRSSISPAPPASPSRAATTFASPIRPCVPRPPSGTSVEQGQLEASNTGSAEAAVRLVSVMRQFEMLQKAVSLGAEMNKKAIEEVAKV